MMVGERRNKACAKCDCLHYPWSSECNRCCFRIAGVITRSNLDKSALSVRKADSNTDTTISYDCATRWVKAYHGTNTVAETDPRQIKEGDRVLIQGNYDDKGELHATLITKRLSK